MAAFQLASASSGVIRDSHYAYNNQTLGRIRTLLLEGPRTNLALRSEALSNGSWTSIGGTGTAVDGADTSAGLSLSLLTDTDAAVAYTLGQVVTFTGDAVKAVSAYVKQGTSVSSIISVRDTTASAWRLQAAITWSAGVPIVTMTTGTNVLGGTLAEPVGSNGVYRVLLATSAVTAANQNQIRIEAADTIAGSGSSVGTVLVGGVQAEDATSPSSYIPTVGSTVARNADQLTFPWSVQPPQTMTFYTRFVHGVTVDASTNYHVVHVSNVSDAAPYVKMRIEGSGVATMVHDNGGGAVSISSGVTPTVGDLVELRGILAANGSVQIGVSLNGGAETVSSASAVNAFSTAWAATTVLGLGADCSGSQPGYFAFTHVHIELGVQTLATMRTLSGQ